MTAYQALFLSALVAAAFLYASVGHGGASAYLALMALFGMAPGDMKTTALMMNIAVSAVAFLNYSRTVAFDWKRFLPLALASVPCAFLGGWHMPEDHLYRQSLGVVLLVPAARFFATGPESNHRKVAWHPGVAAMAGAAIGYVSGMIGIGGGILLSPMLLILGWASLRETAVVSALFILVNSVAGLSGHLAHGAVPGTASFGLAALVLAAGAAGSYLGAFRFDLRALRLLLAAVLLIASVKLIFT